ncbi:MAG: RES family NAD+ phosphorylase [Treponema sp.]|nr:RES family NAD+ phosphorylase [Treponema sp.]
MVVFRIARKEHITDLSGKGAELFGGRWNEKGVPALYTSSSLSLAALEILAHTDKSLPPVNMAWAKIYVPDEMFTMKFAKIPPGTSQVEFGTDWLKEKRGLMLKVQSVILPYEYDHEFNLILNPLHPEYSKIFVVETHDFSFDVRLIEEF